MSGVMIKVALYGLIRVLFEWARRGAARGSGSCCSRSGCSRRWAGSLYALVQHELKRLLAFYSIENVGIVALALGASLCSRGAGDARVARARVRGGAAARRQPRGLQGAAVPRRRRVRARGRRAGARPARRSAAPDAVDGRAFLVGCAGDRRAPAVNGFASEWLTLQALLHVASARRRRRRSRARSRSPALAATAALALLVLREGRGLVLLGAPRRAGVPRPRWRRPLGMRAGMVALRRLCVVLGARARAARADAGRAGARGGDGRAPARRAGRCPAPGRLPALGLAVALARAQRAARLRAARTRARGARRRRGRAGSASTPALRVDVGRLHQAAAARARGACCGRAARSRSSSEHGLVARSPTPARCRIAGRRAALRAGASAPRCAARRVARRLQTRQRPHVRAYLLGARRSACSRWPAPGCIG